MVKTKTLKPLQPINCIWCKKNDWHTITDQYGMVVRCRLCGQRLNDVDETTYLQFYETIDVNKKENGKTFIRCRAYYITPTTQYLQRNRGWKRKW